MDWVTSFLNGWAIAVLVGVAILLWAVGAHIQYSRQFRTLQECIREAAALLSSIPGPTDFHQRFRMTGHSLEKNPVVGNRWKEYRATLLPARRDKPLRSPRAPSEFFNEDLYLTSNINVRAYEALANQFVGVGLCLTFAGLIYSLWVAHDIIGADGERATNALSTLLAAASFKFITSGIALIASVIFVFAKNGQFYRTEKEIETLCEQIERLIPPVTPEELAEESNEELARQGEQLAAANRTLATGIADALEAKLTSAMTVAMEPLVQTVRNMTERLSDMNKSALEHMAQRFSETLSGAAREHTDQMARLMRESADAMGESPQQIRAATEAMGDELKRGAGLIETALGNWPERMTEASDAASKVLLDHATQHAEALSAALKQESTALLESISGVADQLATAPDKILQAGDAFSSSVADATANVRDTIEESGRGVASAFDTAGDRIISAGSTMEGLVTQTDLLADKVQSISKDLAKQVSSIFDGAGELTRTLSNIASDVSVAGEAAKSLAAIAEKMEVVNQGLSAGVKDLLKAEMLSQATAKDTQAIVAKLGEQAGVLKRELDGVQEVLAEAFKQTGVNFEQLGVRTTEYMTQLDEGMAKGLSRFRDAILELDRTVSKLAGAGGDTLFDEGNEPAARAAE